jgi:hypothetical protein
MRSLAQSPVLATDTRLLAIARWRPVAPSETSGAHASLRPATDPVNAGVTVRIEWAGLCRGCRAPIWSSVSPGPSVPRLCPTCRPAARAGGRPVGAPIFRPWLVARIPPPPVPGPRGREKDTDPRKTSSPATVESSTSKTVFRFTTPPAVASGRAFHPGRPRLDLAERRRRDRARLRTWRATRAGAGRPLPGGAARPGALGRP